MRGVAWAGAVIAAAGALGWALALPRSEVLPIWAVMAGLGALAVAWVRWGPQARWALLAAAAVMRLAAVAVEAPPQLSEDWVRYAWDGWVLSNGEWPTWVVPAEAEEMDLAWNPHADWMVGQMNSAQYPGVYPPAAQLVFALPWWAGIRSPLAWWRMFQLIQALLDVAVVAGLMRLLQRAGRSERLAAAYAFHPLVLFEGVGNGHLEGWVVAAGVMAALAWPARPRRALGWAAAAVAIKWLPVLALPAWAWRRRANWRSEGAGWLLIGGSAVAFAALAWPSMRLFLDRFEFNAGPYYAIRNAIMHWTVHNPIRWLGPAMTGLGAAGVMWSATRAHWSLAQRWAAGWGMWLACATTVHPWYAMYLVPLGLFTGWRWPFAAAGLVLLSYGTYAPPWDGIPWEAVEWGVLIAVLLWDGSRASKA